jgi:hypothetical protein
LFAKWLKSKMHKSKEERLEEKMALDKEEEESML